MRQMQSTGRRGRELGRREGSAAFHSLIGPLDRPEAFGSSHRRRLAEKGHASA